MATPLPQIKPTAAETHFLFKKTFSSCWCCLSVFPKLNFQIWYFASLPWSHINVECCGASVCARRKVCVCMAEREKTEQDGKRSTESQDENKIKFVEKYDFLMTSVSFLTCSKLSVLSQMRLEMTALSYRPWEEERDNSTSHCWKDRG